MTKINRKVERFFHKLLRGKATPKAIKDHIAAELKKRGTKELSVDAKIKIALDTSKPSAARKAAIADLLKIYRGE